ncbi:MAG: hypothetical protein ACT4P1_14705 [Sporichthyaceae bacterium]
MSAHERRVLAATAREFAAQDAALAEALRTWTEPTSDLADEPPAAGLRPAPWPDWCWRDRVRAWLRNPVAVAATGGLLFVGSMLMASMDGESGSPEFGEVEIFTEQVPTPLSR